MNIRFVEAFYKNDTENELYIHTDEILPHYQVYWTYENTLQTHHRNFLFENDQKQVQFEFVYPKHKRVYFIIHFDNGIELLFGHRILPIDGLYNCRDIGGYLTDSKKRIKWGKCYRSDYLYYLKDSSLDYMMNLGIQTIIDFRSLKEISESPNRHINEKQTYVCDPNAQIAEIAGVLQSGETKNSEQDMAEYARHKIAEGVLNGDQKMIDQQIRFTTEKISQEAFSKTIKILSNPQNCPSFQHCRGGKDRTGFALMLLEGILGVHKEDIVYDYLLTAKAREEKNKLYYKRFLEESQDEAVAHYMYSLFDTKESYILASIDKILDEYQTIANYAKIVLGITDSEIEKLKEIYLE